MNRLKDLREDRDLKQSEVSKALGLSVMAISRYEREENALSPDLIAKFCKFYNVTSDYLLGLSNQPHAAVSNSDTAVLAAYHAAPAEIRAIVDTALAPYKKESHDASAAS